MRKIDTAERRRRIAVRHHLAPGARARSVVEAARDLVGLHATDPASVYLEALARMPRLDVPTMEEALYEERSLLKVLGMRRTMFVVPPDLAPVIQASCTRAIGVTERKRLIAMLAGAGVATDPGRWLRRVEDATMRALEARGEAVATELSQDVPELALQIPFGEGKKWQGVIGVSTRVLFLLSMEGRIIRARPRGTWISSQYRWTPTSRWLQGGIPDMDVAEAKVELVRRWLAAFGPGTVKDIQWWTGWTLGGVRKALAALETVEVELEGGGVGVVPADDVAPTPAVEPWVALLPSLDATVMGWASRDWYLGEHRSKLFDRNGNAGPTVWADGRVVGGWGQDAGAHVVYRLFEDLGKEAGKAIERETERITAFLGGVRVTPRFRTPLEQELGV